MSDTRIAMKKTVEHLRLLGYDISSMHALDLFARAGDWLTAVYSKHVAHVVAWEINPIYQEQLEQNLSPNCDITIGDTHKLVKECTTQFDWVVSDNPMGCYGCYCEHFDILDDVMNIIKKDAILTFNVKTEPFNYEDKLEWQARRNIFYGTKNASKLDRKFVFDFYTKKMKSYGRDVVDIFWKKRPQESGLYLMTLSTRKLDVFN